MQARLRALDSAVKKPQRLRAGLVASAVSVCAAFLIGLGVWGHEFYASTRAVEMDLSRAVIAAATARGIEPLVLWDDVSERLGRRLDARRPNLGLSGDDVLRAYGIVMEGVYPLPKIEY